MLIKKNYIKFIFVILSCNKCTSLNSMAMEKAIKEKLVEDFTQSFNVIKNENRCIQNYLNLLLDTFIKRGCLLNPLSMKYLQLKIDLIAMNNFLKYIDQEFLKITNNKIISKNKLNKAEKIKTKPVTETLNINSSKIHSLILNSIVHTKNTIMMYDLYIKGFLRSSITSFLEEKNRVIKHYRSYLKELIFLYNIEKQVVLKKFKNYVRCNYINEIIFLFMNNKKHIGSKIESDINLLNSMFNVSGYIYKTQKSIYDNSIKQSESNEDLKNINNMFDLPERSVLLTDIYNWLKENGEYFNITKKEFDTVITNSLTLPF